MTTINLNLSGSTNLAVPAGWNKTGTFDPRSTTGTVISDLLDDSGASTGITFSVLSVMANWAASAAWVDADAHGIPAAAWREAWAPRSSTVNGSMRLSGFAPGQTGALLLAGHTNNAARPTDYFINGGPANRYTATLKPPAAPISVPFTADASGNVDITTNFVSVLSYLNFIIIEYTVSTAATITDIDDLVSGQPFNVTSSDAGYLIESVTVSDGATSKVVPVSLVSGATYTGTMPQITAGQTALLYGSVTVVATDGTEPTAGVAASYSISIIHPDSLIQSAMSQVQFVSISPDSLSVIYEFDPQSQVDDWGIYDSARFDLTNTCEARGDYNGITTFYFIATADRIARIFNYDTDASDNPPVMPDDTTITVFVGDTVLVTGGAISGTAPITYTLGGADAALFSINSSTGDTDFLAPATVGSGQITRTATNSVDSATQTINFVVSSVPSGDDRGLTARGLTAVGPTATGLTAVGL